MRYLRLVAFFALASVVRADPPDIGRFYNATAGRYQVFAQSGGDMAWRVNAFMNEMLKQYSKFFSNWTDKDGARVVVFDNLAEFRAYSTQTAGITHYGLAGYCHLVTDEADNTFYELVTYEHTNLWRVLAHEGFHQFLGYEVGTQVPVWLNEGLAQYFETSDIDGARQLHVGASSKVTLGAAQYLISSSQAPTAAEIMEMDRSSFYANAQVAYPMSWALVHYLLTRDGSTYRSSAFRRYLQDLKFGRDEVGSFQRRFGRNSYQWQRDFELYVLRLKPHVE